MKTNISFSQHSSQFSCPSGAIGKMVGREMDRLNDAQNNWVLSLLPLKSSSHILELGFGTGKTLKKISQIVLTGKIAGVEKSSTMMTVATKNLETEITRGQVTLTQGDSVLLPFSDQEFNLALAVHVVYFWDPLPTVLTEIYRVLQPDGIFALYFVSPLLAPAPNFKEYTAEQLKTALRQAGFNSIKQFSHKFDTQNGFCLLAYKLP